MLRPKVFLNAAIMDQLHEHLISKATTLTVSYAGSNMTRLTVQKNIAMTNRSFCSMKQNAGKQNAGPQLMPSSN